MLLRAWIGCDELLREEKEVVGGNVKGVCLGLSASFGGIIGEFLLFLFLSYFDTLILVALIP